MGLFVEITFVASQFIWYLQLRSAGTSLCPNAQLPCQGSSRSCVDASCWASLAKKYSVRCRTCTIISITNCHQQQLISTKQLWLELTHVPRIIAMSRCRVKADDQMPPFLCHKTAATSNHDGVTIDRPSDLPFTFECFINAFL